MKGIGYILMLLLYCEAAKEDIWMNWAVKIKIKDANEFCNGVLVTYSQVLTTCECVTHPHFVFPEFLRRTAVHYVVEIREHQEGYQSRDVLKFDPHPKCTSSYIVQGLLTYNFATATTAVPFQCTKYVHPIEKRQLNSAGVIQSSSKCTLMGRKYRSLITPYPIKVRRKENCSERASLALGSKSINFEEKGMMCVDVEWNKSCNTSGICYMTESQAEENFSQNVQDVCDGIVVSGAPVICDGALAGLVSHGLCKLNSAPVIITRIELTNSLVHGLSFGAKSTNPQIILTISAAVMILKNLEPNSS